MRRPLEGIRIIDSTTILAAPYGLALLGDMGADVIKIETHTRSNRSGGSLFRNEVTDQPWNDAGFVNLPNRSKRGITLDLKQPAGYEALMRLIDISDVFVENNRPGAAQRLGIDYETLRKRKPDIIVLSNSGFGQDGPWKFYGGIGRMLELTTGLSVQTGYQGGPPHRVGESYVDPPTSYAIVLMIMMALVHRKRTGEGQYIDLSMYQVGVSLIGDTLLNYLANGEEPLRRGNRDRYLAPQGVYPCQGDDNWVALTVRSDAEWAALCQVIGQPEAADDPRFADSLSRLQHQDELDALIAAWSQNLSKAEAMEVLQAAGIPAGAVNNGRDMHFDPQLHHRGFWEAVSHTTRPHLGTRVYPGRPYRFSKTPVRISRAAPKLGEHNREVLRDLLGYSDEEVDALERDGVIGDRPAGGGREGVQVPLEEHLRTGYVRAIDPDFEARLAEAYPASEEAESKATAAARD